jgi:UDP-2-acetamido-3-amino-2,3-dideoxy-glucuronate N-acetyltransferase
MAVFNDLSQDEKLVLFNHKIEWIDRFPVPIKAKGEAVKLSNAEPLLLECRHFLECLEKRKAPRTSGDSALKVLRVLQACQTSLENKGVPGNLKLITDSVSKNNFYQHPTSIVEQPCRIGEGTKIWHYSHIMKGAKIGCDCNIGQNVYIASNALIGNNEKIQNNVSVYQGVILEDDVFCGPSVVFTNVINPRSQINRKDEYKKTLVKRGASLGANCTIVCGNSIGEYAFIGAGSVVTADIPDYALAYGNPARLKGWMCRCGIKLNIQDKRIKCASCGKKYVLSQNKLELIENTKV